LFGEFNYPEDRLHDRLLSHGRGTDTKRTDYRLFFFDTRHFDAGCYLFKKTVIIGKEQEES
jgi:hypothetical protein